MNVTKMFKGRMQNLFLGLASLFVITMVANASEPLAQKLVDLNGKTVVLDSAKSKMLVVFWATWCPDCREKLSDELVKLNKNPDVDLVAISTESDGEKVKKFVEGEKIQLRVLRDPEKELRKQLKVTSVPHWAVYSRLDGAWKVVDSAPAFEKDRVLKALGLAKF